MPSRKDFRRKPPTNNPPQRTLEVDQQTGEVVEATLPDWEPEWREKCKKTNRGFFDSLLALPEAGLDQCFNYLYRLEPRVVNQQGPSYIDKYPPQVQEEQIKSEHGGGKYMIILRNDRRDPPEMVRSTFRIDGAPRYKEGQTLRDTGEKVGPNSGPNPDNRRSEIAEVVEKMLEAGKTKGTDAAISIMETAMQKGMEMQNRVLASQLDSTTGSKMGDKLLEALLPKLLNPPTPPPAPTLAEQLSQLEALAKILRPEPATVANPAPAADPIATMNTQLGFVKELLGVDSISDLMQSRGRVETPPWWAGAATRAIEILPGLMDRWSQTQMAIANSGRATPMRPTLAGTHPQPTAAATPINTAAPAPTPQPTQEDAIRIMVSEVCRAFDGGFDGFQAAAHLELSMPQALAVFKPMLLNPTELSNFVAQVPPLAERAAQPEWAEFQRDFVQGLAEEPIQHEPPKASAPQAAAS